MAWAAGAVLLVAAAMIVPHLFDVGFRMRLVAESAPLFGKFRLHTGPGTVPALVIAFAVVLWGPALARRLPFGRLVALSSVVLFAWALSLGTIAGWQRLATKLSGYDQYLHEVPGASAHVGAAVRDFARRIPDYQPDSWTVHVSGHPPGALLTFVGLDRIGLGGGTWAALFCTAAGASAAAAVLLTVRTLGTEEIARCSAPFLALFPGALWLAPSGDAYFAGTAAWGIAALAVAAVSRGRRAAAFGVLAGLILGWSVFLNYGLVLMGLMAVTVLLIARNPRPLFTAVPAALAVVGLFALAGFWWLDGYHGVVLRYYQGIASFRPFVYWGWANLAAAACAFGVAGAAAIGRVPGLLRHIRRPLLGTPAALIGLVAGAALMVLAADLSALSKAEVERIWLPFTVWIAAGAGMLWYGRGDATARAWLAAQAVGALLVAHTVLIYQ
ncbi:hypothetical protein AXK60_24655 [Tsukamurella pseudospumae]|uniref:Integral membrane protein n=1 Tax=Tsukamurella pseudospumae TaxID=239498 RepID=A0A138AMR0_9ACTN|nr:hypothetical protein AXK61_03405 [Tsukamurella pseudospumae]KXP11695.1 hypothetical protein AXK60_24655 [Tsukamurella pseudospumae]